MFLQEKGWRLQPAIEEFLEQTSAPAAASVASEAARVAASVVELSSDSDSESESAPESRSSKRSKQSPSREETRVAAAAAATAVAASRQEFALVTWNLDGINGANLRVRTEGAARIARQIQADVLLLQEVVPESEGILRRELEADYAILSGRMCKGTAAHYYTLTLVSKGRVRLLRQEVVDYEVSLMTRNVLLTGLEWQGVRVTVCNTHLESTKEYSRQRMEQLRQLARLVASLPSTDACLVAGDLNLRDSEAAAGLPEAWIDAWEATGKRPEARYTWDTLRNDNLASAGRFKPRCRFDRVLLRDSRPHPSFAFSSFSLIGLQRLRPHRCFPSDHWGLLVLLTRLPPPSPASPAGDS